MEKKEETCMLIVFAIFIIIHIKCKQIVILGDHFDEDKLNGIVLHTPWGLLVFFLIFAFGWLARFLFDLRNKCCHSNIINKYR